MELRKTHPVIHTAPEFKKLRKVFQGINSTSKGSVDKSVRRHKSKALKNKLK